MVTLKIIFFTLTGGRPMTTWNPLSVIPGEHTLFLFFYHRKLPDALSKNQKIVRISFPLPAGYATFFLVNVWKIRKIKAQPVHKHFSGKQCPADPAPRTRQ